MKLSKKIRIFAFITAFIVFLFSVTAFAAEKLDRNMSGADMTFSERLEYALQGSATGMVMVFAVLALLWGIVSLSKYFLYDLPNKRNEKANAESKLSEAVAEAINEAVISTPAPVNNEVSSAQDDGELAAVITAAIAAMIESGDYKNEFVGGFRVVSFKRSSARAWNRK